MVKKRRRVKDIKTYPSLQSYCSAFYQTRDFKRLKGKRKERKEEGKKGSTVRKEKEGSKQE